MAAPTATKKRAPKPATKSPEPVAQTAAAAEIDTDDVVVITKRDPAEAPAVPMVTIFELDDEPYQMPAKPTAPQVMSYFNNVRNHGQDVAIGVMIADLLGEEAITALAKSRDVSDDDAQRIFAIVTKRFLGHLRTFTGN